MLESTAFSDFFRKATDEERGAVYTQVMEEVDRQQRAVIRAYHRDQCGQIAENTDGALRAITQPQ